MIRQCDACGSDINRCLLSEVHCYTANGVVHQWEYKLVKCGSCGLVFIDPRPDLGLLQTFYGSSYDCYKAGEDHSVNHWRELKYQLARLRFANEMGNGMIASVQASISKAVEYLSGRSFSYTLGMPLRLPKDAVIFEIGYGGGDWLLYMHSLGYRNLHGFDINANKENVPRLTAKGIVVSSGDFMANDYSEECYDAVRLEHVFEHLQDPQPTMTKCFRMLRPGGFLVMTFPCVGGAAFEWMTKSCALRDSPRHLFLHTRKSTNLLLRKAGFGDVKLRVIPSALVFGASVNNNISPARFPMWVWNVLAPIYGVCCRITGTGELISVLARKS